MITGSKRSYIRNIEVYFMLKNKHLKFISIWLKALRFHFTPCSTLPALLGSMIVIYAGATLNITNFILLMIAVTANHLAVNMTDDYFDFLHGADVLSSDGKNAYAGGSGVLVAKEMSPELMRNGFLTLYLLAASIGFYFVIVHGWIILLLGVIGIFSSYFYTAPPIRFSYHGLGELVMLINLGPVIALGASYLQDHRFMFQTLIASLPLGLFVFAQIICNEIPDYETDKQAGKRTLVVRFGKKVGLYLSILAVILSFSIIVGSVILKCAPVWIFIVFVILPLLYRAFSSIRETLYQKEIRGNFEMVQAHVYASVLLIIGYGVQSILDGKDYTDVMVILGSLCFVIMPVIIKFRCH